MSDDTHPDGCKCEDCERLREREQMKECYPEEHRRLRHERGKDSEPRRPTDIPNGMSDREAIERGLW